MLIEVLEARNSELSVQVASLEERLVRLERLVSRNSGNSSMPPSSDDMPGRRVPGQRKRGGTGKRPGKQPGAPGGTWPGGMTRMTGCRSSRRVRVRAAGISRTPLTRGFPGRGM
jgi:hypothetical protein